MTPRAASFRWTFALLTMAPLAGLLTAAGCSSGTLGSGLSLKMPPSSQRPPQLDRLNAFVGSWQSQAEQTDTRTGAVTRITATTTSRWVAGDRFLLQESTRTRGGSTESQVSITTWDPDKALYRQWSFDSSGAVVAGEDWDYTSDGVWRSIREADDGRVESVMRISPEGSQMDVTYDVWGRGGAGKVATGKASATRVR